MDSRLFFNTSSKIKWVHGILCQGVEVYGDRGQRQSRPSISSSSTSLTYYCVCGCMYQTLHLEYKHETINNGGGPATWPRTIPDFRRNSRKTATCTRWYGLPFQFIRLLTRYTAMTSCFVSYVWFALGRFYKYIYQVQSSSKSSMLRLPWYLWVYLTPV